MLHKRTLGFDRAAEEPAKRLRANLTDLYASGAASAERTRTLFEDASSASAQYFADLQNLHPGKNVARDLSRRLTKHSKWPKPYWSMQG